jgi:Ulp1 family protease
MEKEHDGLDHDNVTSSMITRLRDLKWTNQSPETTRQVLELIKRASSLSEEPRKGRKRAQVLLARPIQALINEVEIQWAMPNNNDVVSEAYGIPLKRVDLKRLKGTSWLNDNVMQFYMKLLLKRDLARRRSDPSHRGYHFMNSQFMSQLLDILNTETYTYKAVKRWTRPAIITPGLFEHHKVFIPINNGFRYRATTDTGQEKWTWNGTHWTLAVIDFRAQTIQYYDSLGSPGHTHLAHLLQYLKDDWSDKKPGVPPPDWSQWRLIPGSRATPQQIGGNDCGVFVLAIADLLSQDLPAEFTQDDINKSMFRHRIAYRILKQSLEN